MPMTNINCYECKKALFEIRAITFTLQNLAISQMGKAAFDAGLGTNFPFFRIVLRKPYTNSANTLITEKVTLDNV